jgi:hypothetical protein
MKKKTNKYDLSGDIGIGYATNTDDIFYFDLEDYDKIKDYAWHCSNKDGRKYMTCKRDNIYYIHKIIMKSSGDEYVDHKNRDTLDNRKINLRITTNQQNSMNCSLSKNNTSGVTGVYWDKTRRRWTANIKYNYKDIYIGRYKKKEDAIVARLEKEAEIFGEYSGQIHLFEKYDIETNFDVFIPEVIGDTNE